MGRGRGSFDRPSGGPLSHRKQGEVAITTVGAIAIRPGHLILLSTRMITSSFDGTARVWSAASGKSLAELKQPAHVRRAVFTPDGTRIITAPVDKTARVWNSAPYRERFRQRRAKAPK